MGFNLTDAKSKSVEEKPVRSRAQLPFSPMELSTPSSTDRPEESLSDNELAALACGDDHYFSILFNRFFKPVYRYFYSRLRQRQDAEDLTSETFMKLVSKLETFHERGIPFTVWLFTIARHNLIDFNRQRKIKATLSIEELCPGTEPCCEFDLRKVNSSVVSGKILKALEVLPETQREIWSLKLSADLPHKEIASILGITENNVNVQVSRSTKTLKKYLWYLCK
jgi:RNA polymerase sigma-70 factor (ECF subfamily)